MNTLSFGKYRIDFLRFLGLFACFLTINSSVLFAQAEENAYEVLKLAAKGQGMLHGQAVTCDIDSSSLKSSLMDYASSKQANLVQMRKIEEIFESEAAAMMLEIEPITCDSIAGYLPQQVNSEIDTNRSWAESARGNRRAEQESDRLARETHRMLQETQREIDSIFK